MNKRYGIAVVLIIGMTTWIAAQNVQLQLAGGAGQVSVDVAVSDAAGKPISNLSKNDFEVYEDGAGPREIASFSAVETPYNVLVLIDRSFSMADEWSLALPAIQTFVKTLRPQDRFAIAAFDEKEPAPEMLSSWKSGQDGVSRDIAIRPQIRGNADVMLESTVGSGGISRPKGKDFYGALEWATQQFSEARGRKGIIVFSDGMRPTDIPRNHVTLNGAGFVRLIEPSVDKEFQKALRIVRQSEIRMYMIAVGADLNPKKEGRTVFQLNDLLNVRARLEQFSETSGGRIVFPDKFEDTMEMFRQIAFDMGAAYSLRFKSEIHSEDGRFHTIVVRTRNPGNQIRLSREGYYSR